jgi:Bacteriophage abortive infection AbiH
MRPASWTTPAIFLVSYGAEDWSDANHHDYQFEIQQIVEAVSSKLKAAFVEWIRQLPIPLPAAIADRRLRIDPSATFLNFNYTKSLEQLYGIASGSNVQIHGDTTSTPEALILGHGWGPSERKSLNDAIDHEAADTRVLEGNQIIDQYFEATFKPTTTVIARHQPFFSSLDSVTEIITIGHSLGDVDLPYFREIVRHIDVAKVTWKVCYHGSALGVQQQMAKLGIDPGKIEFILANEI